MKGRLNDSSTRVNNALRTKGFLFTSLAYIVLIICLFRWISVIESKTISMSMENLLRDEYANANSYLVSKRLSDFENIGLIKCVILKEEGAVNRVYYKTHTNAHCSNNYLGYLLLKHKTEFVAINGLKYNLTYETPIDWKTIVLEALLILIGIGLIGFYIVKRTESQKAYQSHLEALALEKELLQDRTSQVSHDVASPLTAIRTIAKVEEMDESYRQLLSTALERTEKIFSDLKSDENKHLNKSFAIRKTVLMVQKEKELSTDIKISFKNSGDETYVVGEEGEFSRIISNIFNNCINAADEDRSLNIFWKLSEESNYGCLVITDNGIGIPTEIIPKLGTKGFSYGKNGSGLGLYHAKKTIKNWGGSLNIDSNIDKGTTITIKLLLATFFSST